MTSEREFQGAEESFNVSAEMNDLVNKAENWAISGGLNSMPEVSQRELQTHRIGNQILTRAALMLMKQMGVAEKDIAKYTEPVNYRRSEEKEKKKKKAMSPVSPMPMEEFRNNIRDCVGSPGTPRRRAALMAEICSVPRIDLMDSPPKKFIIPKTPISKPARRSLQISKPVFASTPIPKRSSDIGMNKDMRASKIRNPLAGDVTPFENRASRLRRQKMEETRKSLGGNTTLDSSMNSSFGFR